MAAKEEAIVPQPDKAEDGTKSGPKANDKPRLPRIDSVPVAARDDGLGKWWAILCWHLAMVDALAAHPPPSLPPRRVPPNQRPAAAPDLPGLAVCG